MSRYPFLFLFTLLLFGSCAKEEPQIIVGNAQGTTYRILYFDPQHRDLKAEIDSILLDFDNTLSTWNASSIITGINKMDSGSFEVEDPFGYLLAVFQLSKEIHATTGGAFDPTVMPLVKGWGFGLEKSDGMDSTQVDSLLALVSFESDNVNLEQIDGGQLQLYKKDAGVELDFNAIAQGYSVDVLSNYLLSLGIQSHLVELGGEVMTKDLKPDGSSWTLGIDQPVEDLEQRAHQAIVSVRDKGMATSGNYRKFIEINGERFSHTLNPETGFPAKHNLLSATVLAADCGSADAYATAFMVMGLEKSKAFIEAKNVSLEAYLIYANEDGSWSTWATPDLYQDLKEVN